MSDGGYPFSHTNDAESEAHRFKSWVRGKADSSSKQKNLNDKMNEYVAQTNLGEHMKLSMSTVLEAFRTQSGCPKFPVRL